MSKSSDLVFESDKLEKRQKIKRILIPIAVLLIIVAVVVVIAVIAGKNKRQVFRGGEDTLYPYFWTENKDGSLTVRLPETGNGTYVWTPYNSVEAVAALNREEKGEEGYTVYTAVPQKSGRTLMEFVLKNETEGADAEDQIFSINLILEAVKTETNLKLSVLSGTSRTYPGVISGGEAEGFPYAVRFSLDGELLIRMKDGTTPPEGWSNEEDGWYVLPENPSAEPTEPSETFEEEESPAPFVWVNDWNCVSADETIIRVLYVNVEDGFVEAALRPGEKAGSCEVRVFSTMGGAALSLMVRVAEDGTVSIPSHVIERMEPTPIQPIESPANWYDLEESTEAGN